jgi:nicotinamide mononucleotide adenylyltransferase
MDYIDLFESFEVSLEEIFEAFTPNLNKGKKNVLVVPGRYSVPHLGHFELFTKSMELFGKGIDELVIAIVMGGKSSENKDKNPTTFAQRKKLIETGLKGQPYKVTVIQVPDAFPSGVIHQLREKGKEPVVFVAGEDRVKAYTAIVNKSKSDWNSDIEVKNVPPSKRQYSDKPRATDVRKAIRDGKESEFKKMMPKTLHNNFSMLQKILNK